MMVNSIRKVEIMDKVKVEGNSFVRDTQVGGDHYRAKAIQPWEAMEAWMSREEFTGFLRGNVIKYICRYKDKNGVEDLRKASHYLDKLIEVECEQG